jgi:acetyl-CoA carboxylase biotin carboxyl carrier protein
MKIQARDIDALIEIFESSTWDEMHLQADGVEIFLSTDPNARHPGASVGSGSAALVVATSPAAAAAADAAPSTGGTATGASASVPANWVAVTAPNLGTFYRAPKPGAPAFVEIGQSVEPQTEICLLEVMKLFTTMTAGVKGTVRRVCVKDAVMVEHGDVLFYIEPA